MLRAQTIYWLKRVVCVVAFLSFFIIPFLAFGHSVEESARSFFDDGTGNDAAMVVAGLLLAADPVLPTPSSVVATLLGAKVGLIPAALVNSVALTFACCLGYALGRVGGDLLARTGRRMPAGFADWVRRHGLVAVLLCRPVPVLAEASLMVAGAAHHAPRSLLAWCCATQTLLGFVYAYVGSGWGQGRWDSIAVFTGSVVPPLAGALMVALSMWLSGQARRKARTS